MPQGGTGQVQVTPTLTVHDAGKLYPSSPSYAFSIYDSMGHALFEWKEDGLLSAFLLTLGEPFRILAGSGINTTGTAVGSFDYESAATFSLDVVQMPDLIPVPLPSSLLFLLSGLLAVGCGRGTFHREG
ncbi:MAG: hypothetical protein JXL84_20000 [Deltaproteobacteria bacterium]|nr:hypothetical protein [Deltaproteobacteria bacterium]